MITTNYTTIWRQLLHVIAGFSASEVGPQAKKLFVSLLLLLLGISGLNVLASYVGRDFITALARYDATNFAFLAVCYVGVFALATLVAVFYRYAEERLGLLWRNWLTRLLIQKYLEGATYYRLQARGEIDNPDERIADDVRAFTTTTLSFLLMILNGTITTLAFSGVLWSISPVLLLVAVLYAVVGSYLTIWLGRPLVALNFHQLEREANFRADLLCVREHAEVVALSRREHRLQERLLCRLNELVANLGQIIRLNRNLGFFTTGYNQLIQIVPVLVVAPLYLHREIDFGVITQSTMAFAHLLGAFSLIVTQFQSISSFAAVISRLSGLGDALEQAGNTAEFPIKIVESPAGLIYDGLTLKTATNDRVLLHNLRVTINPGTRVLITSVHGTAKRALFRATAGIWDSGSGTITRPPLNKMLFLPERPYIPPGTLREFLANNGSPRDVSDRDIDEVVLELGLEPVTTRAGGLDTEQDWASILSLSDQQRLAFARLFLMRPQFAFLDRVTTLLTPAQLGDVLVKLTARNITYLTMGESVDATTHYDAVLEIDENGAWKWTLLSTR